MLASILALITLLGPIFGYIVNKIVGGLNSADDAVAANVALAAHLADVKNSALKAVKEIDITFVSPAKVRGTFTSDTAIEAKALALEKFKSNMGTNELVNLAMVFQTNADGLNGILNTMIEAAIYDNSGQKMGSIALN